MLNRCSTTELHCPLLGLLPLGNHSCYCIHAHSWLKHHIAGWPGPKVGAKFCRKSVQFARSICEGDEVWVDDLSSWVENFLAKSS